MGALKKADFYYGALLSVLINGGIAPALFEKKHEKRQIYNFSTNKDNYLMYAKFHTSPTGTKDFNWSFVFTEKELVEIQRLRDRDESLIFAFICCQKKLNAQNQEIAIVHWDEFIECVDIEKEAIKGTQRLSVKLIKGARTFRIYGSKKSDMLEQKDNTIRIDRNRLENL